MTRDEIIETAVKAGMHIDVFTLGRNVDLLESFAKLVAQQAQAEEREAISDEWWSCYQSDLENGVKSLNEYEAKKFAITYPELAKFGAWIDARGQA